MTARSMGRSIERSATMAAPAGAGGMAEQRSGMFWMAAMTILLALIPVQFYLGTLLLSPLRLFLLIVTPFLIVRWLRGEFGRLTVIDYALMTFWFWIALSMATHIGARTITFMGSNILMMMGGYLVARAAIRSAADFRAMTYWLAGAGVALLPLALYEAVWHNDSLILTWLAQFENIETYGDSPYCCRMGLTRAQTVFVHPIHFGIYCAMSFSIVLIGLTNHVNIVLRVILATLVAMGAFTTVSSSSLIVIMFQLLLIVYVLTFHSWSKQWYWGLRIAVVLYIILELNTTKFAMFTLAEKLAFNAGNVYTRQLMFETGVQLMRDYPLFGWGVKPWPLPHWFYKVSIDNYWIVLGGSFGIPALASVGLAMIWAMWKVGGDRLRKGSDVYWVRVSWTVLMIGLILCLGTVHLWASILTMVYFIFGAGLFLLYVSEPDAAAAPVEAPTRRRGPVYSRFPNGARPAVARGSTATH